MAIDLPKDTRQHLIQSIVRYFADHMDEEIGELKATFLLDFCLQEIGPSLYNQGVADAQTYLHARVADLDTACYEPEFGFWPSR